MDDREIPEYFICPISLQIMKDPVTVATGITYDRESIQRWQFQGQNKTCPVTKQLLPIGSELTPNHTLRRLIQAWLASKSVDHIPISPRQSSLKKVLFMNLIKNLEFPESRLQSIEKLENLAVESEVNRVCMKEVGVVKAMVAIVVSCYRNRERFGLEQALNVLYLVGITHDETSSVLEGHDQIIDSLTWVLGLDASNDQVNDETSMKIHAIGLLKNFISTAQSHVLERLRPDFFNKIVLILQQQKSKKFEQGIRDALHVMLTISPWRRNCLMMVEAGVVFELVEIELGSPEKAMTELIMGVLFHLCSCADGRAQLLNHAAGIAVITKRIVKVSQKVDERALLIISLISRFSGTSGVLQEMVRVGTVEKLCMVLQVDARPSYLRDKAREILRRHSNVWKDSPCLDLTLLTRYPR